MRNCEYETNFSGNLYCEIKKDNIETNKVGETVVYVKWQTEFRFYSVISDLYSYY